MNLEQQPVIPELTTIEEIDKFVQLDEKVIIFKAGTCWITQRAWDILQNEIEDYPDIPVAYVTVVRYRLVSNYIAEISGIRHESPQILIMQGNKVLYECNNMKIDQAGLKKAIHEYFKIPAF